jgi:hypothetical protein
MELKQRLKTCRRKKLRFILSRNNRKADSKIKDKVTHRLFTSAAVALAMKAIH